MLSLDKSLSQKNRYEKLNQYERGLNREIQKAMVLMVDTRTLESFTEKCRDAGQPGVHCAVGS